MSEPGDSPTPSEAAFTDGGSHNLTDSFTESATPKTVLEALTDISAAERFLLETVEASALPIFTGHLESELTEKERRFGGYLRQQHDGMLAAVTMPQTTEAEKRARKIEMDTSSKSFLSALDKLESLAVNLQSQESRKSIAATRNLFEAADQPEPWKALFEYSQHRSAMLEKEGEDERSSQALLCDALLARILELESAGPSYHLAMFWAQTGTAVLTALSLVGEGVSNIALCARDIGRAAQSTTPGFSGWSNSQGVEPGTTVQDNTTETVTNDGQVFEDDKPVSIANSKVEPNTTGITARSPYSSEKREALDG